MSIVIRAGILVVCCLFLTNCGGLAGLAVGAAGRAAGTGDMYSSYKATIPGIAANFGRIFIYAPRRGGSVLDTMSLGTGATYLFTMDNDICALLGATFMYRDLPAGDHSVTSDDVKEFWSELSGEYKKGRYEARVNISPTESKYVKFTITNESGYHLVPQLVDLNTAETEMKDLPVDTHFVSAKCHAVKVVERPTS